MSQTNYQRINDRMTTNPLFVPKKPNHTNSYSNFVNHGFRPHVTRQHLLEDMNENPRTYGFLRVLSLVDRGAFVGHMSDTQVADAYKNRAIRLNDFYKIMEGIQPSLRGKYIVFRRAFWGESWGDPYPKYGEAGPSSQAQSSQAQSSQAQSSQAQSSQAQSSQPKPQPQIRDKGKLSPDRVVPMREYSGPRTCYQRLMSALMCRKDTTVYILLADGTMTTVDRSHVFISACKDQDYEDDRYDSANEYYS